MITVVVVTAAFVAGLFYLYISKKIHGKPSVDSIVADITDKVEQLHAVKEAKHLEAEVHNAIAIEKQKLAAMALQERDRAKAIAEKLTALIS